MAKDDLPIEKIKKLSEILQEQNLTEIEIEAEGLKIKVRKEAGPIIGTAAIHSSPALAASTASATAESRAAATNDKLFEVKSPMVGTFYSSPSPDSAAFVKVGSKIKKGDSLCIIEAMKLMNEVPSDVDGEIAEILVSNSEAISFGQVLMKVKIS